MTEKILDNISLDFDIKNHRELTPYVYFTQNALDSATYSSYNYIEVKNSSHETWTSEILNKIEEEIYTEKYFGKEKEKITKYQKLIISQLKRCLAVDVSSESIESQFCHSIDIVKTQQSNLYNLLNFLKKKVKSDLKQMAISTRDFPHFTEESSNHSHNNNDSDINGDENQDNKKEKPKKDNEKIEEILSKIPDDNKQNQIKYYLSLDDLTQLYEILEKNKKTFSFSPSFVLSCIQKLDSFINILISPDIKSGQNSTEKVDSNDQKQFNFFLNLNSNNDENQTLFKYYRLSLLIKMRFYMQINRMNDFLIILLELIEFDSTHKISDNNDDHFSFKK